MSSCALDVLNWVGHSAPTVSANPFYVSFEGSARSCRPEALCNPFSPSQTHFSPRHVPTGPLQACACRRIVRKSLSDGFLDGRGSEPSIATQGTGSPQLGLPSHLAPNAGNRHGSVVKRDRCRGHGGFEATISDVVFSFGGLISGVAPALPYTHRMAVDRDVVDRPIQAVGAREHDVARHESARTVSELNNGCQPWTLRMTADDCGDVNRAQEAHAVRSLPCWRRPHRRRMRSPRAATRPSHPAEGRHPKSIRSGAKR